MKHIFISSVVKGLEKYRGAAKSAVDLLYHKPVMSESFGARPYSSEVACITEVEKSDVYLLILGEGYGYETQEGISVTQSEFRAAKAAGKTILVFIQSVEMELKQQEFKREVKHYHDGFYRASFSSPSELKDEIIKGLREFEQTEHAISESEFEKSILDKTSDTHSGYSGDAELVFAFLPQPQRECDLDEVEQSLDDIFQNLYTSGAAKLSDGYDKVSDRDYAGLKTKNLTVHYYEDGLMIFRVDPTIKNVGSFSSCFVSPLQLTMYAIAFHQLIQENAGYLRIELRNMENKYVAEPPETNSLSMRMNHQNIYAINKLCIPLTESGYKIWIETCIKKFKRQYKYEHPQSAW